VLADSARADAAVVDGALPLAGTTFAAKDLFDVAGHVTLAGSKINAADGLVAAEDATLVARLKAAGSVLVGLANMDEYAYGFSTENAHYGPTRNPHDRAHRGRLFGRIGGGGGGGAGGCGAGVGYQRVCPRARLVRDLWAEAHRAPVARGVYPFVASLDHAGLFARDPAMLAAAYDALQGPDPRDPAHTARRRSGAAGLAAPPGRLRVGVLGAFSPRCWPMRRKRRGACGARSGRAGHEVRPAVLDGASERAPPPSA
jgi:aspartyl-tRNA(Asn)/glutamyl-tRNA(Gln) amidotransferase subunit A